jgi:hypothetical protein
MVLLQKRPTGRGNPDDPMRGSNESEIIRVLPNGKPGARSAPGIHDFLIGSLALGYPSEKVEDESFHYSVGHGLNIQ